MSAIIKAGFTIISAYLILTQGNIVMKKLAFEVKIHVLETIISFNKISKIKSLASRLKTTGQ